MCCFLRWLYMQGLDLIISRLLYANHQTGPVISMVSNWGGTCKWCTSILKYIVNFFTIMKQTSQVAENNHNEM